MTTQITEAGIAAAIRARNNQGPKINITTFKIGPTIQAPTVPVMDTDITDSVYTGSPSQLQYAIVDNHTVEYVVTLDESVGPFNVGRIGLFMDNGDGSHTLFSITSINATAPDVKWQTSGSIIGNRLTYSIYLAISNVANIANFTIQLLQLLSIPEVSTELLLPDPAQVAFNTYQVMKHSITRIPAIAYRQPQGWFMGSERLIPGQGEGIIPVDPLNFDGLAVVDSVVGLDFTSFKIIRGEPATNKYILGVRSSTEEITDYGEYVIPANSSLIVGQLTPYLRLFVDTAGNAGKLTITPNNWPCGFTIKPVNTTNAQGYLCWLDFTSFFRAGQAGPPGPPGPKGDPGSAGGPGSGGGGFSNSGNCYLQKIGNNLVLAPYNGNGIVINSTIQKIPVGGVVLPPTGLSPNTRYYIYAFMSSGVMTLMASTTGHITSTFDGVEIINTDQTKSLVGMAYTVNGPAWADGNAGQIYVLSWFNPRSKSGTTFFTANHTMSGSQFVEIGTEIRNYFLTWANREVRYVTGGYCGANGGDGVGTTMSFDGIGFEKYSLGCNLMGARPTKNDAPVGVFGVRSSLTEGLHWGTLMGMLAGGGPGTAYWNLSLPTGSGTISAPVSLTVTVEG